MFPFPISWCSPARSPAWICWRFPLQRPKRLSSSFPVRAPSPWARRLRRPSKARQATFSQATYELTLRNAGAKRYFAVLSPDCQTGPSYTHWETGADGAQHASGAVSLFGEASTLTFVPCRDSQSVAEVYARQQPLTDEQKALSFTVELE